MAYISSFDRRSSSNINEVMAVFDLFLDSMTSSMTS